MKYLDKQPDSSKSTMLGYWRRIPILVRAIVLGFFVSTIGVYSWLVIGSFIPGPWSIVVMGGVLWLYWRYFSGSWWSESTTEARKNSFRAVKMPGAVWRWGFLAAMLIVVTWQSGLVLTFRFIEYPVETFIAGYDLGAIPLWLAWLMVMMSSLVAGICEETGYRGYAQVPLEERFGPAGAITIVSIIFLVIHLQQVWAPPVLFHLFALSVLLGILAYASGSLIPGIFAHTTLDIFNFSYWWTDIAGRFDEQPIAETGMDAHFILWALIFVASVVLFAWAIRKTLAAHREDSEANP